MPISRFRSGPVSRRAALARIAVSSPNVGVVSGAPGGGAEKSSIFAGEMTISMATRLGRKTVPARTGRADS